jgi:RecB family exonuclease
METMILRPTGVQTYLSCPRKYFFGYVENAPRLVSAALAIGSAFHKATEVLVGALKARRRPTDVLQEAENTLEESIALEQTLGDADPDDDKFDTAKDVGIGLLRAAATAIPETWAPAIVEETAVLPITEDISIRGTTDLVLTDGTIVDFKTRARKSSVGDIRRDLQFTAYAMIRNHADGRDGKPRNLAIVELTKTKIPAVHIQPTERTADDFAIYTKIATNVAIAIRAGMDHPSPGFLCGCCGHRRLCPLYRRN